MKLGGYVEARRQGGDRGKTSDVGRRQRRRSACVSLGGYVSPVAVEDGHSVERTRIALRELRDFFANEGCQSRSARPESESSLLTLTEATGQEPGASDVFEASMQCNAVESNKLPRPTATSDDYPAPYALQRLLTSHQLQSSTEVASRASSSTTTSADQDENLLGIEVHACAAGEDRRRGRFSRKGTPDFQQNQACQSRSVGPGSESTLLSLTEATDQGACPTATSEDCPAPYALGRPISHQLQNLTEVASSANSSTTSAEDVLGFEVDVCAAGEDKRDRFRRKGIPVFQPGTRYRPGMSRKDLRWSSDCDSDVKTPTQNRGLADRIKTDH